MMFSGTDSSRKTATPLIIGRLQDLDLDNHLHWLFARDMFCYRSFEGIPFG